jgi:hypothetical protein
MAIPDSFSTIIAKKKNAGLSRPEAAWAVSTGKTGYRAPVKKD